MEIVRIQVFFYKQSFSFQTTKKNCSSGRFLISGGASTRFLTNRLLMNKNVHLRYLE